MNNLSRLHARIRANFRRKAGAPVNTGEPVYGAQPGDLVNDGDWRRDFQSMDELEAADISRLSTIKTYAVGGVVIFGWQEFKGPSLAAALEQAGTLQTGKCSANLLLTPDTNTGADFSIVWRDAMVFEMGLEQYHHFLLERRKRAHRGTE